MAHPSLTAAQAAGHEVVGTLTDEVAVPKWLREAILTPDMNDESATKLMMDCSAVIVDLEVRPPHLPLVMPALAEAPHASMAPIHLACDSPPALEQLRSLNPPVGLRGCGAQCSYEDGQRKACGWERKGESLISWGVMGGKGVET